MLNLIEQYGIYVYGIVILFGGIWGVNFFPYEMKEKYKFALFASLFAVLFILLEYFVSNTFVKQDVIKYLLTYTVVTSCYELFMKQLFIKWGLMNKDDDPKNPQL